MVARHNGIVEARSSTLLCSTTKIHRQSAVYFCALESWRVELVTVVNEAPVGPQSCDLSEAAAEGETLLCSKSHILSEPAGECVRLSYPPYSFSKNFNCILAESSAACRSKLA